MTVNGQSAGGGGWGGILTHQSPPGSLNTGYGTVDIDASTAGGSNITPLSPGAYVEAQTDATYYQQYTYSQITASCGAACGSFYDPYHFSLPGGTGEGSDLPSWSVTVWAAPIILVYKTVSQIIGTAHNGATYTAAGSRSNFKIKFRSFIPPAWVNGPFQDFCTTINGIQHDVLYGGDNRSFDPFATSYRATSEALISLATSSVVGTPVFKAGTTYRYADDALPVGGYTLGTDNVLHDCHLTDNILPESAANMYEFTSPAGPLAVQANLWGTTTNLASTAGPGRPQYLGMFFSQLTLQVIPTIQPTLSNTLILAFPRMRRISVRKIYTAISRPPLAAPILLGV